MKTKKQKWTSETPTESGFYWYCYPHTHMQPSLVYIHYDSDTMDAIHRKHGNACPSQDSKYAMGRITCLMGHGHHTLETLSSRRFGELGQVMWLKVDTPARPTTFHPDTEAKEENQ